MNTKTLAVPTVGRTPRSGAGLGWQPSSAPTGLSRFRTGLPGVAGVDCAAAPHGTTVALAAPVAIAASVDAAALPFVIPTYAAAATATQATKAVVPAVAGNQQDATAPKQAEKFNATTSNLVNVMRENAFPRGDRAGAPPS